MSNQGIITSWKDDRGYGFIAPSNGSKPVFVHIKSFTNQRRRPIGNEIVTYDKKADSRGRFQAVNVEYVGDKKTFSRSLTRRSVTASIGLLFLGTISTAVFIGEVPITILMFYVAISVVSFVTYALDKSAARSDRWRIKESTLHLFDLIGGWPGALLAQAILRHKSRKREFQSVFWITVVLNCIGLAWVLTPSGSGVLQSIPHDLNDIKHLLSGVWQRS